MRRREGGGGAGAAAAAAAAPSASAPAAAAAASPPVPDSDQAVAKASAFELYNLQGDSAAAYEIISPASCGGGGAGKAGVGVGTGTLANRYNCMLLSRLQLQDRTGSTGGDAEGDDEVGFTCEEMIREMEDFEDEFQVRDDHHRGTGAGAGPLSARKRKRDMMIRAHNRALALLSSGNATEGAKVIVQSIYGPYLSNMAKPSDPDLASVVSRMGLVLLECMLALSVGRGGGGTVSARHLSESLKGQGGGVAVPTAQEVFDWLDLFDSEKDPQLKFLLNLYRSRVDLAVLDDYGKHSDAKIRSARKELKQAMDVLQHKLRPSFGVTDTQEPETTGSVVSSANSEDGTTSGLLTASQAPYYEQQQQPSGSIVLQKHNRSALSLKGHTEQLKGNTKKSLILCSEALASVNSSDSATLVGASYAGGCGDTAYETVHSNNLAIVYETIGKRHLALHALAKGLRSENSQMRFYRDGTSRPDQTLLVIHNAAICSLQARNYLSAYECMATCVSRSEVFRKRPRCWLRMAEACVGVFSELKSPNNCNKFSAVEIDG